MIEFIIFIVWVLGIAAGFHGGLALGILAMIPPIGFIIGAYAFALWVIPTAATDLTNLFK
jgi:hypothetical protein